MASPVALQCCSKYLSPSFTCHHLTSCKLGKIFPQKLQGQFTRRLATVVALATAFLAKEAISGLKTASPFDLGFTVPDQTPEEADLGIRIHAKELLEIKALIDSQSWREAQRALRESSAFLKQDLYTIIQAKPGSQRPQLRKLYSNLFNNASRLDYAARSNNASEVQECYYNIVAILDEIFARI